MIQKVKETEISLLLEVIYQKYGYDFRDYSALHVLRRIKNRAALSGVESLSLMRDRLLRDEEFARQLITDLSITVTAMFRDPEFYQVLREKVIPVINTYPFIRVWHAGCATGEEVYSLAILLYEEGLYNRTTVYATDFNQDAINKAKEGIYSNRLIKNYTQNYQQSGGKQSLSDYYTSGYDAIIINRFIKQNIVWANHNLVTDSVFAEVHLILCRNVLIYFNTGLQHHTQQLFFDSLVNGGFLCLGLRESLPCTEAVNWYSAIDTKRRVFKKNYQPFIKNAEPV